MINVKNFGAKGDGVTDDTLAIQLAIDHARLRGLKVFFPKGVYLVDGLTVYVDTYLVGTGKKSSILKKKTGSTDLKHVLSGIGVKNVSVRKLGFEHQSNAQRASLIMFSSTDIDNPTSGVIIEDCSFEDNMNGRQSLVLFYGYTVNCRVFHCDFKGFYLRKEVGTNSLLIFDNAHLYNDHNWLPVSVESCNFDGGSTGVALQGSGIPPAINIKNNEFRNQQMFGLITYHGSRWDISGNHFRNINAEAGNNDDGGVVWLDLIGTNDGRRAIFSNNIIEDCTGNAILLEEFSGLITDNIIRNISKRTTELSKTYTYGGITTTHSSYGGNAIQITGGCEGFTIQNNKIERTEAAAIRIDRAIGIQQTYYISGIIKDNEIIQPAGYGGGIEILEKVDEITLKDNIIRLDYSTAGVYGIKIDRINTSANNSLATLKAYDNEIIAYTGFYSSYSYVRTIALRNTVYRNPSGASFTLGGANNGWTKGNYDINASTRVFVAEI